jgi:hypothetical protein
MTLPDRGPIVLGARSCLEQSPVVDGRYQAPGWVWHNETLLSR